MRLLPLLPSGAPDLRRKYLCVRRTVGCELNSLHLQRARRRFVNCSDRPRCLCLRRRTYSGTTWMMANPWTSRHRCNRRCSSTRKIYGLDSVVYFFYYLSVYLPSFWIPLLLCSSYVLCCLCIHVSLPMPRHRFVSFFCLASVRQWPRESANEPELESDNSMVCRSWLIIPDSHSRTTTDTHTINASLDHFAGALSVKIHV